MWALTTAIGYVVQFELYQGAKGDKNIEYPGIGIGGSVIMDLVAKLIEEDGEHIHYHLTFEKLFTSLNHVD